RVYRNLRFFFFSSRRRHTRSKRDWSSDVCSSDLIIRDHGAVPATIAIMDGKIKIGLSDAELENFGQAEGIAKVSRRDLPYLVATGQKGATTVAATMICAELAGIRTFVTGGIGGVHRGAETSMDISADLEELA